MLKKIFIFKLLTFLLVLILVEISLQIFYRIANGDFLNTRAYLSIYKKSKNSCWGLKPNLNLNHKTSEFKYKIFSDVNSFRNTEKFFRPFFLFTLSNLILNPLNFVPLYLLIRIEINN